MNMELVTNMRTPKRHPMYKFVAGLLIFLMGVVCNYLALWYCSVYGDVGFDAIVSTLLGNLDGMDPNLLRSCLKYLIKYVPIWIVAFLPVWYRGKKQVIWHRKEKAAVVIFPLTDSASLALCAVAFLLFMGNAAQKIGLPDYIHDLLNPTTLFEEEYWHPDDAKVEFPEEKRNLIYIFMESMETTFFSGEEGGAMKENLIPELYALAEENVNFSHSDGVGGLFSAPGTTWTVAGLVSQTAGVPLKIPFGLDTNGYGADGVFLPGIQSLSNVLHGAGYNQSVMFGSLAEFGGRLAYFSSHGTYNIYDLRSAWKDGLVPDLYHNGFWGFEDRLLYQYAKDKILEMASEEGPFAFTMLTVDTHFPAGYICQLCEQTYEEQYDNVYRCASRQLEAFLLWLEQQDFYENTTIVITGDHLSMDGGYMYRNSVDEESRRLYNCIINSAIQPVNSRNRQACAFDMFPTTLAALGCTIGSERLGLGTNLFSEKPTLMEEKGREVFETEVSRYSEFYVNNFY